MTDRILVLYGSYRTERSGIRLARFLMAALAAGGANAEFIDAREVGLPMLDRMYKEFPVGEVPPAMEALAQKIRSADAFVFVVGEYNWGVQPGLKNLTDHFLEEWFWRPAGVVSYSAGRVAGARSATAWHGILSEMGMVVISSTISVGGITHALDRDGYPAESARAQLEESSKRFVEDLLWWSEAARNQRALRHPPY